MQPGRATKLPGQPTTLDKLPPELANHPQYEVLRELGQGGMGVVYLAKNKLMDRLEVLKVINKTLLDNPGTVERFLREIRAAAKLNHANIVTAYSALQIGDLLAFAMEFVEGEDLAALVKSRGPLPVANACHYVQQAALGLQHAFEKGMVHRDIKPHNLILAREGKKHTVKVLDFGLARATRERQQGDRRLTRIGEIMGTPGFLAPEQTVDAAGADIRADIYGLGCTLYYLLTGQPPYTGQDLGAILHAHRTAEPAPLSQFRADVPESLAAVVRKMMAKQPSQRYQTPTEVVQAVNDAVNPSAKAGPKSSPPPLPPSAAKGRAAEEKKLLRAETIQLPTGAAPATMMGVGATPTGASDVQAVRTSRPTVARQGRGGRPRRASGAWKKWLLSGCLGVGVLLLAVLGLWLWTNGVFERKPKDGILIVEVNEPNPDVYVDGDKATATWDEDGQKAEIRVRPGTHKVEVTKDGFSVWGEEVELPRGKRRVLTARLVSKPPPAPAMSDPRVAESKVPEKSNPPVTEPKVEETMLVVEVNEASPDVYVDGEKQNIVWKNDGKRAEIALKPGMRKIEVKKDGFTAWGEDVEIEDGGRRILTARLIPSAGPYDPTGGYRFVHFGKDRTRLVLCRGHSARVYDLSTGQAVTPPLKHLGPVVHASFSPDGRRVVTASSNNAVRLWDAVTGEELSPPLKHQGMWVYASFSPDGTRVVTAGADEMARMWDVATGKEVASPPPHEDRVYHASFSPDGKRVVTAGADKTARLWDAATGEFLAPPLKHESIVLQASFSPDGKRVVTASWDQTARLWDAATGKELTPPLKHDSVVFQAAFSPDGKRVVTASSDKTARLWDAFSGEQLTPPLKHEEAVIHASFSPDGKRVVTTGSDKTARLWDAITGEQLAPPLKHEFEVLHASFSPDGKHVVTTSAELGKTAQLWDAATGEELRKVTLAADAGSTAATGSPKPTAPDESGSGGTPAAQTYQSLRKQYDDALRQAQTRFRQAKTQPQRQQAAANFPRPDTYAPRFLDLAKKNPADPAALDALLWVLARSSLSRSEALAALERDHVESEKIGPACLNVARQMDKQAESFLRDVLKRNKHREVQGIACLALAQGLSKTDAPDAKLLKEAEDLLERARRIYADVLLPGRGTVGDLARVELFEIRFLAVGQTAPEIEGQDQDGVPMKLSDFRGKVVLLDFWGDWCMYCRKMYPHERDLVAKLADKPFILLGVNSDPNIAALKRVMAREKITWRSWFDRGAQGPIASKWNVRGWPTLYLLDRKGVIRAKWVGYRDEKVLSDAIEPLLNTPASAVRKKSQ